MDLADDELRATRKMNGVDKQSEADIKIIESIIYNDEGKKMSYVDVNYEEGENFINAIQNLIKEYNTEKKTSHFLQSELDKANAEKVQKDKIINAMAKRIKEDTDWYYSDLDNMSEEEIKQYFKRKVEEE